MANDALRYSLVQKLKDEHCLWFFNDVSASDIPDDVLIERQPKHPVISCIVLTPSAPSTPEFQEKTKKNASIFGGFEKKIVTLYRK